MGLATRVPTGAASTLTRTPRPGTLWRGAALYWLSLYRRNWQGSAISNFLAPLLYLGAMGYGLGALVDRSGTAALDGVSYVQFIAPGVLCATAMQTGVGESSYPVMGAVKWQRQFHAMLAAPMGPVDLVLGTSAFVVLRVAIACAAFTVVAALLGAWPSPLALVAALVAVLCGAAHAPLTMAFSAAQDNDYYFALLFRFGVLPAFLFAGTFFPVDQLPAWIRPLAWVTPLWHATTAARQLALGTPDWPEIAGHCAYLLLWVAAGVWIAVRVFTRRLVT
jgi:lipooligosaccharide transport system permease protein